MQASLFRQMSKRIRIKDIAERAGVSIGTVDRVIHNRGEVNAETRQKILDILNESGYQPNLIARALTSKKEYVIAVLIPSRNSENPFWEKPLKGIMKAEKELRQFNVRVEKLFFDLFDETEFVKQAQKVVELNPHGAVIAPIFSTEARRLTAMLDEAQIPYLFMNSDIREEKRVRFVGQDSFAGGYVAAKLIHYGLKQKGTILIVNNTKNSENFNHFAERNRGFTSYFKEHKMAEDYKLVKQDIFSSFDKTIQVLFQEHPDIVAIYVSGAKSYLTGSYLERIGRKDIILIGYDLMEKNTEYLEKGYIDFIISQRSEEQGYLSVIHLFNHIAKGETETDDILMPIDIITKENYRYYR